MYRGTHVVEDVDEWDSILSEDLQLDCNELTPIAAFQFFSRYFSDVSTKYQLLKLKIRCPSRSAALQLHRQWNAFCHTGNICPPDFEEEIPCSLLVPPRLFEVSLTALFDCLDIAVSILKYIPGRRLLKLRRVCRRWNELIPHVPAHYSYVAEHMSPVASRMGTKWHHRPLSVPLATLSQAFPRLDSLNSWILENPGGVTMSYLRSLRLHSLTSPLDCSHFPSLTRLEVVRDEWCGDWKHLSSLTSLRQLSVRLRAPPKWLAGSADLIDSFWCLLNLHHLDLGSYPLPFAVLQLLTNLRSLRAGRPVFDSRTEQISPHLSALDLIDIKTSVRSKDWPMSAACLPALRSLSVGLLDWKRQLHPIRRQITQLRLTLNNCEVHNVQELELSDMTHLHSLAIESDQWQCGILGRLRQLPSLTCLSIINAHDILECFVRSAPNIRELQLMKTEKSDANYDISSTLRQFHSLKSLGMPYVPECISTLTNLESFCLDDVLDTARLSQLANLSNLRRLQVREYRDRISLVDLAHRMMPKLTIVRSALPQDTDT